MDFHFASAWEIVADKYPNRVATISDDTPLSWKDFERRASCIAIVAVRTPPSRAPGLTAAARHNLHGRAERKPRRYFLKGRWRRASRLPRLTTD